MGEVSGQRRRHVDGPCRADAEGAPARGEDDGYILSLVRDERAGTSELLVVNAADMRLEATVQLPSRVPYGFHGTFIGARELEAQALLTTMVP